MRVKKALDSEQLLSFLKHHQDLKFFISRSNVERHTSIASLGRFGPLLEDMANLTALPLFGDTKTMGVVHKEEDQANLQLLTPAMTSFKTSDKSTNAL